jgi:hypothetical protein
MTAWPAYLCAAANLVAAIAMATVLAPGTTLVEEPARAAYVRENVAGWRIGWSLWIVATVTLLLFYRWWAGRIRARAALVWIAVAGLATDVVAQSLLIAVVPDRPELARTAFLLTGGAANGLYTLAGALLSRVTRMVSGAFALWTWTMWAAGAALSLVTVLELPLAIAAASAVLFALFIPWCIAMGRRLG